MDSGLPSPRPRRGRPRAGAKQPTGNTILLRGIEVLGRLAKLQRPETLSEIARIVGMSPSRAYRYLDALVASEFVRYDGSNGTYRLGPAALQLGMAAMAQIDPVQLSSEALRELTDATGLASHLCVWGTNGTTVIRWEAGTLETAMRIREGQVLGVLTTSSGQTFLCHLPAETVAPYLAAEVSAWNARARPADRFDDAKVQALRADVRQRGIARAVGMRNPQVAALSAPIFNRNGIAMCMTVSGIRTTFDDSKDGLPARKLFDVAGRITRYLGGEEHRSRSPGQSTLP